MNSVSVVGLGKLGQNLAACFAYRGFQTLGVDLADEVVNAINRGRRTVDEPGLQELIDSSGHRLRATTSHADAIEQTDVTFVLVPSPSDPNGNFSNRYVELSLEALGLALRQSSKPYHLFVISSTVMPGSIGSSLIPLLEHVSDRKLNQGFGLAYCPEFVALGNAIKGFLRPDLAVIGESDNRAGELVLAIYHQLCENSPPMLRMPLINAEIAKVSLNCYVTLKISFANLLANLCEKIPGADVDLITEALGHDRRISPYYFRGGLRAGGTCFPRDIRAFIAFAERYGEDADMIRAVERINDYQDDHLVDLVLRHVEAACADRVSVLGLSFKPDTPVITESPAIHLVIELLARGLDVTVYDPMATENARAELGTRVTYATSARQCLAAAPVCVIATPWKQFRELDETCIERDSVTIVDCWRILDTQRFGPHVNYRAIGQFGITSECFTSV
ncbi:MAG TPA: nucleotide sugar dehydrogenase [Chloroflexota bacterium]|nr:nucleotide sugar dehydrogenase [Chloroflexota bacterium]